MSAVLLSPVNGAGLGVESVRGISALKNASIHMNVKEARGDDANR